MLQYRVAPAGGAGPKATEADFAAVGDELARAKARIEDMPLAEYRRRTRAADPFGGLRHRLVEDHGLPFATNATVKMLEMAEALGLHADAARTFCNAELPGGFVVALAKSCAVHSRPFDWVASSFVGPGALGDMYGMRADNPGRWLMSDDNNGDVTDPAVVRKLAAAVAARFPAGATLYTSDIGTDVTADYTQGEALTYRLNYGQVLCGLLTLGVVDNVTLFKHYVAKARETDPIHVTALVDYLRVQVAQSESQAFRAAYEARLAYIGAV